jgi:hypothetical protein
MNESQPPGLVSLMFVGLSVIKMPGGPQCGPFFQLPNNGTKSMQEINLLIESNIAPTQYRSYGDFPA